MILILNVVASLLACIILLAAIPLFIRLRWPSAALFGVKIFASALSPVLAVLLLIFSLLGFVIDSAFLTALSFAGMFIYSAHIFMVSRPGKSPGSFEDAFGKDWRAQITKEQSRFFLKSRWSVHLPGVPEPTLNKDVSYAKIPGTGRDLLADIWEPAPGTKRSGLAFIYLHGSAWFLMDKDLGTRPFFAQLAAQGHVIMDIAYRLYPETDMSGMIHDAQRAVAWLKEHAAEFEIKPDKVVIGGGSAGGHLSLMTAFTANDGRFKCEELRGKDLSVAAVISEYGPTDLEVCYYHTNQHITTRKKTAETTPEFEMPEWLIKKMGKDYYRFGMNKGFQKAGALAPMLGGHPDENPEVYRYFSPVSHVHENCPPVLLIQGTDDLITKVEATIELQRKLSEKKVPCVMHLIPQTDHAFDLIMPKISPSAHNSIYDVERFLALIANR